MDSRFARLLDDMRERLVGEIEDLLPEVEDSQAVADAFVEAMVPALELFLNEEEEQDSYVDNDELDPDDM